MKRPELFSEIRQAFTAPTIKQQEVYARFLHTLAAASVIGEATLIFAEGSVTLIAAVRIMGLTISWRSMLYGRRVTVEGE